MARRFLFIASILLFATTLVRAEDRFTPIAKKLIAAINSDDATTLQPLFDQNMRALLTPPKLHDLSHQLTDARGKMLSSDEPHITGATAVIPVACERGSWNITLTLDADDKISGLYFREPTASAPVPDRNSMLLRLPFEGQWTVFWGGSTEAQNTHVTTVNQRRALDLIITDAQGRAFAINPLQNKSYYCYDKPILAPADGEVVMVVDGVPDNTPGSMNPYSALGNCIMLKFAENEYGVIAHLIPGSPAVKVGQKVKAGDLLGRCGNSGNSSQPHLHFHLQNSAVIQDGIGFAPYFHHIKMIRNGQASIEDDVTPVKDDRIEPAN